MWFTQNFPQFLCTVLKIWLHLLWTIIYCFDHYSIRALSNLLRLWQNSYSLRLLWILRKVACGQIVINDQLPSTYKQLVAVLLAMQLFSRNKTTFWTNFFNITQVFMRKLCFLVKCSASYSIWSQNYMIWFHCMYISSILKYFLIHYWVSCSRTPNKKCSIFFQFYSGFEIPGSILWNFAKIHVKNVSMRVIPELFQVLYKKMRIKLRGMLQFGKTKRFAWYYMRKFMLVASD